MTYAKISRRVLVVDDNLDSAAVLAQLLEILGLDTAVANSGAAAIAVAQDWHPDVVLMDLNMPGMDGYETAQALRAKHAVRIVAYSADTTEATLARLDASPEFDAWLTKPAGAHELLSVIEPPRVPRGLP